MQYCRTTPYVYDLTILCNRLLLLLDPSEKVTPASPPHDRCMSLCTRPGMTRTHTKNMNVLHWTSIMNVLMGHQGRAVPRFPFRFGPSLQSFTKIGDR